MSPMPIQPGARTARCSSIPPTVLVTRTGDDERVRASTAVGLLDPATLARSEVIEWPTVDGTSIYGVLYRAQTGAGPRPTLVSIHGGPTSEVADNWDAEAQY